MNRTFKSYLLLCTGWMFVHLTGCSTSSKELFEKSALELNRSCPTMIDSFTQMDSVDYLDDEKLFRYYYTLFDEKDNPDIAWKEREELSKRIIEFMKHEPAMATHRRHHIIMEYIYFSHCSGNEFFRIRITPDMYR